MTSIITAIKQKYATAAAWRPFFFGNGDWLRACFLHLAGRRSRLFAMLRVPLRPKGDNQPIYCRPGTSDFVTFHEIFISEEYRMAQRIPASEVRGILDLGANIGLAARWFLMRFPGAQVVAVEPDVANAAMAQRNLLSHSSESRHRVVHAFAGGASRRAFLRSSGLHDANEGVLQDAPVEGQTAIPVMTGAELCHESPGPLDLLKIDIEGSEKELLESDVNWLRTFRWMFIEVHDPLDEAWLNSIVADRLAGWEMFGIERRHAGAFLALLRNQQARGMTCD